MSRVIGDNLTTAQQAEANLLLTHNPYVYKGYYYDSETGYYYLKSRYYDPRIHRFISADKIDYLDPKSLSSLNLYVYCGDNPVMGYDPSGKWDWGNFWKILGGVALIGGLIVGSVLTAGALSVILAGAAIGAISGGVSAGISAIVSGGDLSSFANSFLMGTITGAMSGALMASGFGIGAQMGFNAAISTFNYAGTQLLSGNKITLGGILVNAGVGALVGWVGGNGWLKGTSATDMFTVFGMKNFIGTISTIGSTAMSRIIANTLISGFVATTYGRYITQKYNEEGDFFGW